MIRRISFLSITLVALFTTAIPSQAQTAPAPSFSLIYSFSDQVVHSLADGQTVNFPAVDINGTTVATMGILNQGNAPGAVSAITLTGSGFRLIDIPLMPATVGAGQALVFGIVFAPTQPGTYAGGFRIDVNGRSISGSLAASTAPSKFSLSYIDLDTSNILPLADGATLTFPNTPANAVTTVTVLVSNTGTGTGYLNSLALSSAASGFQLVGLPIFPLAVPPSQQLRFGIRFSPQQQQTYANTLQFDLNGATSKINLTGAGVGPLFTYSSSSGTATAKVSPGDTLSIPDTVIGQTTGISITVLNGGTGDGRVQGVSVSGQGFSLASLPALPATLHPNDSQRFTLNFTPAQPGVVNGQLTIGSDTFAVTGNGLGSRLTYSYGSAGTVIPVSEGGAVIITPMAVGSSANLDFSIQNTGTSASTISSINLTVANTVFVLQNLPSLPLSLAAGATSTFSIHFAPNSTGSTTAVLRINNSNFTLSGTGTQPPSLPSYQFQGFAGNELPARQPPIGLSLLSAYPLPLQGTLTLAFVSSAFADDPAIQFASGGRTVKFTIPANSTQALFNGTATSIPLQTGTTAGQIVITPSFAMQGGFDMTPASPPVLNLNIPRSVPQLVSATIAAESLNSFAVVINAYSTTRVLRQFDIKVTPQPGQNFPTTHITIDASTAATTWFQGASSLSYGGGFSVTLVLALQNGSATDDLVHRLQSLTITATNDIGTSTELTIPVP